MAYLVRSMQTGGDLAKMLWRRMIENAEDYLEEGVRAGTIKPSRDPKARAKYLGITGGGGFLLYCKCTKPQRICGRSCATTPGTWCCPPSRSTPKA